LELLKMARATFYRQGRGHPQEDGLRERIRELAHAQVSFGYRRITAVLRRQGGTAASAAVETARLAHFGPFSVNLDARILSRDGAEITLTGGEYELLEIFVTHANRALSRDWLMDQLRGFERDPFDRSIDVRVNRLRKKIEDDPANPAYIRTQRGQGYLFVPQGKG